MSHSFITLQIYTTLKLCYGGLRCRIVSLPYRFTLLSNYRYVSHVCVLFHYPIDLHYSQTRHLCAKESRRFHYPIDLHYSQTGSVNTCPLASFHYPIDLHYSQTASMYMFTLYSFITLQIYTTLKRISYGQHRERVSLPYRFTLLSNYWLNCFVAFAVSLPYRFTLLSNKNTYLERRYEVSLPYRFTLLSNFMSKSAISN